MYLLSELEIPTRNSAKQTGPKGIVRTHEFSLKLNSSFSLLTMLPSLVRCILSQEILSFKSISVKIRSNPCPLEIYFCVAQATLNNEFYGSAWQLDGFHDDVDLEIQITRISKKKKKTPSSLYSQIHDFHKFIEGEVNKIK